MQFVTAFGVAHEVSADGPSRSLGAASTTTGRVIRLHDLRHTNASLALSAGVDLRVVSERLGHSQIAITTDLYIHVNLGLGKAAAEQIARALKPKSPAVPTASLPQTPENAAPEGGDT